MVVTGSKIRTISGMVKHFPAELPQQLLCVQCCIRASVVVEQSPSDYHLFQDLEQYFPSDNSTADRRLSQSGSALRWQISSTPVYRNWFHGMTHSSIPVVRVVGGS
ncbi:hypothetical protein AVEN_206196-1 [Araneus ventricosus]|uniref:Uncharacterized protein n=1 Tax=Araneus ventricosus TaxID=182803 RepID=A0A4Y2S5E8_ARAVE|nr:hypothetical protein AVEN_206196-1 [Araneus ventricosus]